MNRQSRPTTPERAQPTTSTVGNEFFFRRSAEEVQHHSGQRGAGETDKQSVTDSRPDFWTTTSNKQLNFLQHVKVQVP